MANRFYTVMIVPEGTQTIRKIVIPAWLLKGAAVTGLFAGILAAVMLLDYWYVMGQISENKQLKIDNRRLKQQVQVFKNKMTTVENTLDRIKTFATRLKVITNIEDRSSLIQSLNQKLPDASTNIGTQVAQSTSSGSTTSVTEGLPPSSGNAPATPGENSLPLAEQNTQNGDPALPPLAPELDPETLQLRQEYERLDSRISELNQDTLLVEQVLQDQYELLSDQKAFLAALPTRKPVIGYYTSGFGVRKSPIGGREKMHEGLDIANHPGTPIKAPADGTVIFASSKPGYGQIVVLDHGYGLETWYGHTRRILVQTGQKIKRGDTIALLGNSGRSTGPHVHYEVRVNGYPVDPLSYILED